MTTYELQVAVYDELKEPSKYIALGVVLKGDTEIIEKTSSLIPIQLEQKDVFAYSMVRAIQLSLKYLIKGGDELVIMTSHQLDFKQIPVTSENKYEVRMYMIMKDLIEKNIKVEIKCRPVMDIKEAFNEAFVYSVLYYHLKKRYTNIPCCCGQGILIKRFNPGRSGSYFACSKYPQCKKGVNIPGKSF